MQNNIIYRMVGTVSTVTNSLTSYCRMPVHVGHHDCFDVVSNLIDAVGHLSPGENYGLSVKPYSVGQLGSQFICQTFTFITEDFAHIDLWQRNAQYKTKTSAGFFRVKIEQQKKKSRRSGNN